MLDKSSGISKRRFCGLVALLYAFLIGLGFLIFYQKDQIYVAGLINQHSYGWIEKSYYSQGVLGSFGSIIAGQIRRSQRAVHVEYNYELTPLGDWDVISATMSLFFGIAFMTAGLYGYKEDQFGWPQQLDKWCFTPFVFFFAIVAAGTHRYLKAKQDTRQWVSIALITVSLMILLIAYGQPSTNVFVVQVFAYFNASLICYTHFWVKLEFILKIRACTIYEVAEKLGTAMLICYTGCLLCTPIFEWSTGDEWIFGIYVQAVFHSASNFFLTVTIPFVYAICIVISLAMIQYSSVLRFLTIISMPLGFAFLFSTARAYQSWSVITSVILFFAGLVAYNAFTPYRLADHKELKRSQLKMRRSIQESFG